MILERIYIASILPEMTMYNDSRNNNSRNNNSRNNQKKYPDTTEKLQKVLARNGLGSRRELEKWIENGRIQVNRHVATLGERVSTDDEIHIDGRKIRLSALPPRKILCYHKPVGEVCTRHDPEGRKTVFERFLPPRRGRWISVGRLDLNTAGLLLMTTDGELAHRLMHPSYNHEREYAVRVLGEVNKSMIKQLYEGVTLDDYIARFKQIVNIGGTGANHWFHVTLDEGRKNEVRRLWESQGVTVSRLIRIRFGQIILPKGLPAGRYIELDAQSEKALLRSVGLKVETAPPKKRHPPHFKKRTSFVKHRR
jgi:23S rRNA pseudouridine2605 synthase